MLATRGSGKVTIREALANNKIKSLRLLEHTLSGHATRKAMLEIYHCITSESFTTLARMQQNVAIANGHYKSDCPVWKFQNRVNKYWKEKSLGDSSVIENNVDV
ncbi:hypothetical protein Tco_1442965 [Tanacetum coccineum]